MGPQKVTLITLGLIVVVEFIAIIVLTWPEAVAEACVAGLLLFLIVNLGRGLRG